MLKIHVIEFILRTLPESFLIMLAVYLLSYKRIEPKRYSISSIFVAVTIYLVRQLPINFGVHTIISMIICILIIVLINNISSAKAISSLLKVIITISICEWINIAVLDKVMNIDTKVIFSEPLKKMLYSTPSMVMFGIIIFLFYRFKFKIRMELSNVYD